MTDSLSYGTLRSSLLKEFSRCDWHKQSSWRFLSSLEQSIAALYLLALIRRYFESCSGDESYSRGQWDTALRATPQSPKGGVSYGQCLRAPCTLKCPRLPVSPPSAYCSSYASFVGLGLVLVCLLTNELLNNLLTQVST